MLCVAQAHSLMQLYLDAKIADHKENPLVFGTELIINSVYRHVIIDGEPLELTRTEFDLFFYMAKHPNQIFSRQQLYRQVWGDDWASVERTRFGHTSEIFTRSWRMSAKTTSKAPEGSAINSSLLLVKNKIEQRILQALGQFALAFFYVLWKIAQIRLQFFVIIFS